MNKEFKYLLFLIWASYLLLAAVLTFTRGFLLIRLSQETFSTCTNVKEAPCDVSLNTCEYENKLSSLLTNINASTEICLPKTAKVILIVIDALKFEFAQYNRSAIEPLPFQNKLTIIQDLLTAYPKNARLMEFLADPPTTTMQRLKALTTGSLPTFVDAGANFAASKITEDNFIHQLMKHGQTAIFMGDDTWTSLYPKSFIRSYPYPSFDVFDLDTVDKGVRKNLIPEINNKDWDLIIAHFLGVDHCGHRYGPLHSEMSRKLKEMNEVISEIVKKMDDETVLFVIGDHGMTITGDHGGNSDAEIKSALFAYSNKEFISSDLVLGKTSVKQIDIVPTLSAILGIPIPFSNLGSIILDTLPSISEKNWPYTNWQYSLLLLWSNVKQVTEYIVNYSSESTQFQDEIIMTIRQKFEILSQRVQSISNEMAFKSFTEDAKNHITLVRRMCEEVWVQFDSQLMSRGLCLIVFLIFALYILLYGLSTTKLAEILDSSFIPNAYSAMFTTACVCYIVTYIKNNYSLDLTIFLATSIVSYVLLTILIVKNWETIALNFHQNSKQHTLASRMTRCILFLSICVLFSNSFVVEEGKILSFLLITTVFIAIYDASTSLKLEKLSYKSLRVKLYISGLLLGIMIRASNYYFRCRAEQVDCTVLDIKLLSVDKFTCIIALIALALLSTLTRMWLQHCGNLVGFAPSVLISRYCPTVLVVFIGGFWVINQMPKNANTAWQAEVLPLAIYSVSGIALLLYCWRPLCVYLLPNEKRTPSVVHGRDNIIPQLFHHLKDSYERNRFPNGKIPIVCGLGTVYSSVIINFGLLACLPLALLHGVVLSPSLALLFVVCFLTASILAIVRYETAKNLDDLFSVPAVSVFTWMLLSLYFFYGTGQQPTFPTVQWEAAFMGMNEGFFSTRNIYIRGLLVMLNTFSSQIIVGLLFPILLIAPFMLYVIFPGLGGNNKEKDMSRGELNLYEMNDNFIDGLFVATCKYILYHGVRMFASMLATTILCRHLMVWQIFAPKFIFDGFSLMITLVFVILGFMLVLRVNSQVSKLVVKITKES